MKACALLLLPTAVAFSPTASPPAVRTRSFVRNASLSSRRHATSDATFDETFHEESELFEMGYRPAATSQPSQSPSLPCPNPDLTAEDVVELCMTRLLRNDEPRPNAGLEVCFEFSSDRCRASLGGSLENFIRQANNPTFGSMIDADGWTKVSVGPVIQGTNTRGALQTVLVDVRPKGGSDGGGGGRGKGGGEGQERRFLWTLQQERRPPRAGCWLVHECIFVDMAFALTE